LNHALILARATKEFEMKVWIVTQSNEALTQAKVIAHKKTERGAAAAVKLLAFGGYAGPVLASKYPIGRVIAAADYPA
jgi:hypothetical protein